ncbi:hypothetical protein [Candidatus Deferrimicrobium sp.]|uniref:hypothetical protein n=1 Tax=Candidatus Deferrimicrobium sp. TaxID=3060586 RepID=UPI002ED0DE29
MDFPDIFPFHGNWQTYVEELYTIYINEIVNINLSYDGFPIRFRFHPLTRGKGYGFWHIIQEGSIEEEREPDLRRCERIRWISWIIRNANNNAVISIWEETRGTETNVILWIEEKNYLVILEKRYGYYLLKTAYYTERRHKIETLKKNRDAYWKSQKC